jgi:hypothetical protein
MKKRYFFMAVLWWVLVDYTTAFNPDVGNWVRHMPLIWVFYLGYPLLFAHVIYDRHWKPRRVFALMVVLTLLLELLFFRNMLLVVFPAMLFFIPLALIIYSLITFLPQWIVEHRVKQHRKRVIFMIVVWLIISILSFKTRL